MDKRQHSPVASNVWWANSKVTKLTNIAEEKAAKLAEQYKDRIYFFADLTLAEV